MAHGPRHHSITLASVSVRRCRRRWTGDGAALDLSPLVARPAELVWHQSQGGLGWPPGVQEEDDVHWLWDPPRPTSSPRVPRQDGRA